MKPIAQIRRENLDLAIKIERDKAAPHTLSDSQFAQMIGKDRRQVSAWKNGTKDMADDTAREIEVALRFPANWMDSEHSGSSPNSHRDSGSPSHLPRTDRAKMRDAVALLKHLAELNARPDIVTDPDMIAIAYDFLVGFESSLEDSNVLDLTKRLAAKIRGEMGNAAPERSNTA